jgi:hypothetical protein
VISWIISSVEKFHPVFTFGNALNLRPNLTIHKWVGKERSVARTALLIPPQVVEHFGIGFYSVISYQIIHFHYP